jgi:hypothetical protein
MNIKQMCLENVGQIKSANIEFGDLTVLVGQQATGKTLFLEMMKLAADTGHVHSQLIKHGYDWGGDLATFLSLFLGEGMQNVWSSASSVTLNDEPFGEASFARKRRTTKYNNVFYIPAQRVLSLADGWPRPFQGFAPQDPYVVREFSEQFRILMNKEFSRGSALFPQTNRLKSAYRLLLKAHVFGEFELRVDTHGAQRRLVLGSSSKDGSIPFMAWSAGQREFVPLLLGLYWLLPASRIARRDKLSWAVIEEIEMGLHPSAISTVLLIVLELMDRGYKVCLSTHSPHVLDVVWGLRVLQKHGANEDLLLDMFGCRKTPQTRAMAKTVLKKEARVYYFDGRSGETRDISGLDPGASDSIEAGWGGLTDFSGRVADIVASVVANAR